MNWKLTADRPIYAQIVEVIQKRVLSSEYPLGSSMPSVRVLALEAGVNPNTMQKALAELEEQGLLHTHRTSGRTVTTNEGLIMELKGRIALEYIEQYFEGMKSLGIERSAAVGMLVSSAGSHEGQAELPQSESGSPTAGEPTSPAASAPSDEPQAPKEVE